MSSFFNNPLDLKKRFSTMSSTEKAADEDSMPGKPRLSIIRTDFRILGWIGPEPS